MKRRVASVCSIAALAAVLFVPRPASAARCVQEYIRDYASCADRLTFLERSACALDAEITLWGCVRREILG